MAPLSIRVALPGDLPFLREMLFDAAFWRPQLSPSVERDDPALRIYERAGLRTVAASEAPSR